MMVEQVNTLIFEYKLNKDLSFEDIKKKVTALKYKLSIPKNAIWVPNNGGSHCGTIHSWSC